MMIKHLKSIHYLINLDALGCIIDFTLINIS